MKRMIILLLMIFANRLYSQEGANIVNNPEFDKGKIGWVIKAFNSAKMSFEVKTDGLLSGANYLSVNVTNGGGDEDVAVYQNQSLEQGRIYGISFMASGSAGHTVHAALIETLGEKRTLWKSPDIVMAEAAQTFGPFVVNYYGKDNGYRLYFFLGGKDNVSVNIDAVVITEKDDPNHIRVEEKFAYRAHNYDGLSLPYRFCRPDGFDPAQKYPLVLAMHGSGECGTDNELPISVHRLATSWADSANQKNYPCYVVVPQCPIDSAWNAYDFNNRDSYRINQVPINTVMLNVIDLLDSLTAAYPVDVDRLYVTGLSLGGYGTWDIIMRYPDKFAAAIPMSGGGDSTKVERIKHIPIWNFHGEVDNTVPVSESRKMIEALERQGLECEYTQCRYGDCTGMSDAEVQAAVEGGARFLYTEWKGKDHVMWAESYDYPYLFPWVFAQNRQNNPARVTETLNDLVTGFELLQNYPNPFNPATTIVFNLREAATVQVELYNIQGQRVKVLFTGKKEAGTHHVSVDAAGLPSGKYIYKITAGDFTECKIMTLQK